MPRKPEGTTNDKGRTRNALTTQVPDEGRALRRETPPDLTREDAERTARARDEVSVLAELVRASRRERSAIGNGRPPRGEAGTCDRRPQSRVAQQREAPAKAQPEGGDIDPSPVIRRGPGEPEVPH